MDNLFSFAIRISILCCALAHPRRVLRSDLKLDDLRKGVQCKDASVFYTPNVRENACIMAAFRCVNEELKTVREECEGDLETIDFTQNALDALIHSREGDSPAHCVCEDKASTRTFEDFVNRIDLLFSRMNSYDS